MIIEELEKLLKSKKDEKFELEKEIRELKIQLDIKKHPDRLCPKCRKGFMYDDGFGYADCRQCSNCGYNI